MATAEQMINAQWFIEVKMPGRNWQAISSTDNDRLAPLNRTIWEDAKEEFPNYPLRIKAYVRWGDVVDQRRAEERAIVWPAGAEPARIYKLDELGSPAQTVGPGSVGRGGAVVVTLCQKETS